MYIESTEMPAMSDSILELERPDVFLGALIFIGPEQGIGIKVAAHGMT
jgi:hypothetical protein